MTAPRLAWFLAAVVAGCVAFFATRAALQRPATDPTAGASDSDLAPAAARRPHATGAAPPSMIVRDLERGPTRLERARLDQPLATLTTEQAARELVGEAVEIAGQACQIESSHRLFATAQVDATAERLTIAKIDLRGGVDTDPAVLDCLRRELVGTWTADAELDDGEAFAEWADDGPRTIELEVAVGLTKRQADGH